MNKKLIKILGMMLILTMVLTAFVGCDGDKTDEIAQVPEGDDGKVEETQEQIELEMWHIWPNENDVQGAAIRKVVEDFQIENPNIKIVMSADQAGDAWKTKIRTTAAANELPDVFYSKGAGFSKAFAQAGKLLPLDEYLAADTKDKLLEGTLENLTYDGKVYGLPYTVAIGTFFCNTELFEMYNLEIPETYAQLIEVSKAFVAEGIVPMAVGEKDLWPGMFYFDVLALRTAGADACNSALNKESSFETPEFAEAVAKLDELIQVGAFDKNCFALTRDESQIPFLNGEIPMYFNGSWVAGSIEQEGSVVDGKIVARNFPYIEGANGSATEFFGGTVDTFMVSATTEYKEASVKFVEYLTENFSRELYLAGGGIPTWEMELKADDTSLNGQITEMIQASTGYVMWWDIFLEGADAKTHKELVAKIFAQDIDPEEFTSQMQDLNDINE